MTVRPLDAGDTPLLDRLIDHYEFKTYRHYRMISRQRQAAVLGAEIDRVRAVGGSVSLVAGKGEAAVMAFCRPLDWDSAFFGVPMGKLDYVLRGPGATAHDLRQIVQGAIDACRERGVRHLTAKVDVGDLEGVAALEHAGFRLMDALVSYFNNPRRGPLAKVREFGTVRLFEEKDAGQVLDITREAYQGFRGRFLLDPHIPVDRSAEFYLEWARNCLTGRMADRIVVADDGHGGIHGWASSRRVEPVSSVGGVGVVAGSLGACRRDRPGAYAGLVHALALANYESGIVSESQTQNHNVPTIRIYEAIGLQYARAEYTFHAWLD